MSGSSRLGLQALLVVIAVAVVGAVLWLLTAGPDPSDSQATASATAPPSAPAASGQVNSPTPVATTPPMATATATPTPLPTPTPIPLPFDQIVTTSPEVSTVLVSPLAPCALTPGEPGPVGTQSLQCQGDSPSVPVTAAAPGRIVGIVRQPAEALYAEAATSAHASGVVDQVEPRLWTWAEQVKLGNHVVVDHGGIGGSPNVQTVYAGLTSIADGLALGAPVDVGAELGVITGPGAQLRFGIWDRGAPADQAQVLQVGPSAERQREVAAALRDQISSPTDPRCPLALNFSSLPGAARPYRNGTHQGIDFGCGAAERDVRSIADGTVVYLVDDYADPTVPNREALLANAGRAGFTPFWTLAMLYGNVVVIDHGDIAGAGRVVTISAHLEAVDEAITLGATVSQGDRLGEIGNRGTNASALGVRGANDPSLHLHWELFIDNWYLGSGQPGDVVVELITTALCGAAATAGCPA